MGIFERGIRWVALTSAVTGLTLAAGCSDDSGSKAPSTGSTPKPATAGTAPKNSTPPVAPKPIEPSEPVADTRTNEELIAAGRSAYMSNCIACHNMNPAQDGALGPAVAGSSLALLEARVLRGEYPDGYAPKRPSRVMIPLPHLEPKMPELAVYLQSLN